MTFEPANRDRFQAQAQTESFVTPGRSADYGATQAGGVATATAPPPAPPAPPAAKPKSQLSIGIAGVLAACALVVGGAAGYVIGHSSGSSSQMGPGGQMGGMGGYGQMGGMGGYGPMGGMNGQQGSGQQGSGQQGTGQQGSGQQGSGQQGSGQQGSTQSTT